ncbi:MAG: hypothetical protein U1E59_02585 [Amaricoccus sp.]
MPAPKAALLLALLAAPAAAEDTLTPDAFAALVTGHTLHFTLDGIPFGAEQYFDGQRSLWRFEDGSCESGRWWADGDRICFDYGDALGTECWRFHRAGDDVAAALVRDGAETGFTLRLAGSDEAPLDCPGPSVGS